MNVSDFSLISGQIWLLVFASFILLADAFRRGEANVACKNGNAFCLAMLAVLGAFIHNLRLLAPLTMAGSHSFTTQLIFNDMLIIDPLTVLAKCATSILLLFVFVYSRDYVNQRNIPKAEFYVMGLLSLIGMHTLISSHHFIMLYLGLELMSLPLYAMVALNRDVTVTSEAAIKYFIMGALASGLLLYGISLIYATTGALDFTTVSDMIASQQSNLLVLFGLVFIITGIAFKLGAVPFHMWIPDVYQGAPAAVTLFVATAPKVAALVMVFRLLLNAMPDLVSSWQQLLMILSIASMALGNFVAIMQTSLKRMFAFSTIAHVGYILLGFVSGTVDGYSASLFYMLSYALMSLAAFGMITIFSQKGVEFEWIDDLRGLNARQPYLAFLMLLVLLSLAGIPPLVGFFAKLGVLYALIQAGFVWLAVLALVFAVVGAFYYIRVIRVMYFDEAKHDVPINMSVDTLTLLSVNTLALLILGLSPGLLMALCRAVVW